MLEFDDRHLARSVTRRRWLQHHVYDRSKRGTRRSPKKNILECGILAQPDSLQIASVISD